MLFVYSDHYKCRLDPGGESCLSSIFLTDTPGLGRPFFPSFLVFQMAIRKGMMKTDRNLNVITERVLSSCMLFPGRKYLSGIAGFHLLIRGQSLYCQFSLPCKSFHLFHECRCLRFLRPCSTYKIFSHLSTRKSNRREVNLLTITGQWPGGGEAIQSQGNGDNRAQRVKLRSTRDRVG